MGHIKAMEYRWRVRIQTSLNACYEYDTFYIMFSKVWTTAEKPVQISGQISEIAGHIVQVVTSLESVSSCQCCTALHNCSFWHAAFRPLAETASIIFSLGFFISSLQHSAIFESSHLILLIFFIILLCGKKNKIFCQCTTDLLHKPSWQSVLYSVAIQQI